MSWDGNIDDYEWIVALCGIFAFVAACGIGANDVANAFATSVGSKALTLKQAVFIAAFFEFAGAVLMGSHVTKTIRKGIADPKCFEDNPPLLMHGMMCVVAAVGIWLFVASKFELPVSTTHSTIGGIVFMTLTATNDSECVIWYKETDTFPYMKGVAAVVLSWVISPVFSGIAAAALFLIIRTLVLRQENSFNLSIIAYPILVCCTLILNVFYIVYKGSKQMGLDELPLSTAIACAFAIGGGVAFLMIPCLAKLKGYVEGLDFSETEIDTESGKVEELEGKRSKPELPRASSAQMHKTDSTAELVKKQSSIEGNNSAVQVNKTVVETPAGESKEMSRDDSKLSLALGPKKKTPMTWGETLAQGYTKNLHTVLETDETTRNIHKNAEKFDPRAEEVFKYLQVFTAMCDSFAHGANDVANAMGPFAATYVIFREGEVSKKATLGNDAYWILAIGGVGIVIGLATYGYHIVRAIGVKLAKITPSRGTCIELGSALVVITGSRLEIPLSTTHCQVGATVGVAALEGVGGVNKYVLAKTAFGWIFTLLIVGAMASAFMAQAIYAPCYFT